MWSVYLSCSEVGTQRHGWILQNLYYVVTSYQSLVVCLSTNVSLFFELKNLQFLIWKGRCKSSKSSIPMKLYHLKKLDSKGEQLYILSLFLHPSEGIAVTCFLLCLGTYNTTTSSAAPQKVLQLSHSNACGSQWRHSHVRVAVLLFTLVRLLLARSAYKSPTKNNFTSSMKSRNVLTLPDVMLPSHSIPQACWNVIIEHPFWGAAEQVVVLYVPRPFPSPRSGYGW